MNKNHTVRKKCIICNRNLKLTNNIKDFPVYMGVTKKKYTEDILVDMKIGVCTKCGLSQMVNLIKLNILYQNNHNDAVGDRWEDHHNKFSKFVIENSGESILEVGGGFGKIANKCIIKKKIKKWLFYEPNLNNNLRKLLISPKIEIINKPKTLKKIEKVNTIVHSHVLEHFYDPISELLTLSNYLKDNGNMIIAVPNIQEMLKKNMTNAYNFEHTYFINLNVLKKIFLLSNFKIEKIYKYDEYIFFLNIKKSIINQNNKINLNFSKTNYYVSNFIKNIKSITVAINRELKKYKKNKKYIFGSHIFTIFLLKMGLKENYFEFVLDNSKIKNNKRLYGTRLITKYPQILKNQEDPPVIILKTGLYDREIKKDIVENINSNCIFI